MRWPWSRRASVQPQTNVTPSARLSTRQSWQERARFFSRHLGLVAFAQETASNAGSRVNWQVEQKQPDGTWATVQDEAVTGILSWYRNDWQSARELIQQHLWRIGVDGERWEVMVDRADGTAGFYVVPAPNVQWRGVDSAQIMLGPQASVQDGSMIVVAADRIHRLWTPGKDYPLLAWSPMEGVQEDCERYWALAKYVRKTAGSRLAMNKLVWTPAEAHDERMPDQVIGGRTVKDPRSVLDVQLQQAAREGFERDDSLAGIMPFFLRWSNDLKPPTLLDLSRGLDQQTLESMHDAARAVAVGLPMPASMILGESENHWNEWLMDERSFRWAIAPNVERVANDMTASYLRPTLRVLAGQGLFAGDSADFRVWYDATPVVIHPDLSAHAIELHLAGLLSAVATLESYGFGTEDAMSDEERARWAAERPAAAQSQGPIGAGNVVQRPPALAASLPDPITAEMRAWYGRRAG